MNRNKKLIKRLHAWMLILFAGILLWNWSPQMTYGHASLLKAEPEQNSVIKEPPGRISLTFNERLEDGLYYIKVLDQNGKSATDNQAVLSSDRTGLELQLPKLKDGIYVVSYHIISADGHPVSRSYPITIGETAQNNAPPSGQQGNTPNSGGHHHGGGTSGQLIQNLSRGLWYFTLLSLAGWLIWLRMSGVEPGSFRKELSFWTLNLQRAHLVALLLVISTHLETLLGEGGLADLGTLIVRTSVGLSWLITFILSLTGFVLLGRNKWTDIAWVLALLITKGSTGHAAVYTPRPVTIASDCIHLIAASFWTGGLLLAFVLWRKQKELVLPYLSRFSKTAFISILILAATGILSTFLFLPSFRYLLYTTWGVLLLVKSGLVLIVIIVAAFIRMYMKNKGERSLKQWLRVDFTLMLGIIGIVGFLTYTSPTPSNEPLYWHEMGEQIHMTASITPNVPGVNKFMTKVWLPESMGEPKRVQFILKYKEKRNVTGDGEEGLAPIEVPLNRTEQSEKDISFPGFKLYSYKAEGAFLPFDGKWEVEIRVMNPHDDETVYRKEIQLYEQLPK
ncbi:copper resistance CopC/CopD family protein [Paenibacillus larvae]|uniref:copper resistance CopC/CopD family protein n=1 Tax=Paenibacillus larvae TaxID=1464 RepID=UPI00227E274D|nr:copper resistance protein CopC [Paenibacillus larvae]MCY9715115.1 copper resistance protein CopC/CopD [Paenibacillus larvae]